MIPLDDIPARRQRPGLTRPRRTYTIRGRLAAVQVAERNGLHMITLDVLRDAGSELIRCHRAFGSSGGEAAAGFAARMSTLVSCQVEVEGVHWYSGASGTYLLGCTRADLAAHIDARRAA